MKDEKGEAYVYELAIGTVVVVVIIGLLFFGLPMWNVWRSGLSGEADLNRAEQTKKIMIETARAEKESAMLRAEAIEIMGTAAKNFPEYRQQEFIQALARHYARGPFHRSFIFRPKLTYLYLRPAIANGKLRVGSSI